MDSQARLLTAAIARRLTRNVGMQVIETRYFLYLRERFYTKMASIEAGLSAVPLGGQYAIFCRKV